MQSTSSTTRHPLAAWALLSALVALWAGCAAQGAEVAGNPVVLDELAAHGVSLDALLAPPTEAERAQVRASWRARDVAAYDVRVEARFDLPGAQVMLIISHQTPAGRHVGGVLAPAAALSADTPSPVLVNLHGLGRELTLTLPDPAQEPPGTPPTEIVTVWPSFAGHQLRFRDQAWSSDGDPWDFCDGAGDDALRFIHAVSQSVPGADLTRAVAFGGSRGGNVALLLTLRDARMRRAVSVAGPTDLFAEGLLSHENAFILYAQWLVRPLLDGTGDIADARARLLRCSPLYFAEDLPAVQLHHGDADRNLPVDQTRRLARALQPLGRSGDEVYVYAGADHQLSGHMPTLRARVRAFTALVFAAQ